MASLWPLQFEQYHSLPLSNYYGSSKTWKHWSRVTDAFFREYYEYFFCFYSSLYIFSLSILKESNPKLLNFTSTSISLIFVIWNYSNNSSMFLSSWIGAYFSKSILIFWDYFLIVLLYRRKRVNGRFLNIF